MVVGYDAGQLGQSLLCWSFINAQGYNRFMLPVCDCQHPPQGIAPSGLRYQLKLPSALPLIHTSQRLAGREWPARVSACKLFATAYPSAPVGCLQPFIVPLRAYVWHLPCFNAVPYLP